MYESSVVPFRPQAGVLVGLIDMEKANTLRVLFGNLNTQGHDIAVRMYVSVQACLAASADLAMMIAPCDAGG